MCSSFDPHEYGSLEILTSALLSQASHHAHRVTSVSKFGEHGIKCCCESESCAFFQESTALLLELEKDAETAASLGKALLERHEKYLFEGTRERNKLRNAVHELEGKNATLEGENEDLENENTKTIEENRRLLVQLEEYNQGMSLDEIKVKEMQGDLDALHEELARVATAAARTEILEVQLQALEEEQAEMRKVISRTKEDERAAVARWKQAERVIADLTLEVERIEREHRMEKARAQNLMERLEKRQVGDRRVGTFPSVLAERTAMSQFMRDILAENTHLQGALSELRDMLCMSQEEVGALREQLLQSGDFDGVGAMVPLSRELPTDNGRLPLAVPPPPELHFHHHVHKEKLVPRRVKQRKSKVPLTLEASGGGVEAPGRGPLTPTTPSSARLQRWSHHTRNSSGRGILSFPGSPQSVSTFRDSSVFDRTFEVDSTRPSTADTEWDSAFMQKFGDRSRRRPRDSTGGPPFSILYTEEIPENPAEEASDEIGGGGLDHHSRDDEDEHSGAQYNATRSPTDTRSPSPGAHSMLRKSASHESLLVPTSSIYPPSLATASFNPASPAALAAAAASKDQAISSQVGHTRRGSSIAYKHLHLLAGGNIRGKNPTGSSNAGSPRSGRWFGGWGWNGTPFRTSSTVTEQSETSETDASNTPSAGTKNRGEIRKEVGAGPVMSKPVPIMAYRNIVEEQIMRESLMDMQM